VKFLRRKIGEILLNLRDKKTSAASQTIATAGIASKIYRSQLPKMYSECSRFHANRFTFGGVIAEVKRANTAKRGQIAL